MSSKTFIFTGLAVALVGCPEARTYDLEDFRADSGVEDAASNDRAGQPCEVDDEGPCSAGVGQCERTGRYICEEGRLMCAAVAGEPSRELCGTERDEDCDGRIDEAPVGECCSDDDCTMNTRCERSTGDSLAPGTCADGSSGGGDAGSRDGGNEGSVDIETDAGVDGGGSDVDPLVISRKSLAAGGLHTCAIRRDDGRVLCWGNELVVNATPDMPNFTRVVSGSYFSCALHVDGTVHCWGDDSIVPVPAPSQGSFVDIAAGEVHVCALRASDNTAECWKGFKPEHTKFEHGQADPPTGTAFVAIEAGNIQTCARRQIDERIQCWGEDRDGDNLPPDQLFASFSTGVNFGCGLSTGRGLICWGKVPDRVPAGEFVDVSVPAVAAGFRKHACAVREAGQVACWGAHESGPLLPPSGIFVTVSAGDIHACALTNEGQITCWGSDVAEETDFGLVRNTPNGVFGVP